MSEKTELNKNEILCNTRFYTWPVNRIKTYLSDKSCDALFELGNAVIKINREQALNIDEIENEIAELEEERVKCVNDDSERFEELSDEISELRSEYVESQKLRAGTYLEICCILIKLAEKFQELGDQDRFMKANVKLGKYSFDTWDKVKINQHENGFHFYSELSHIKCKAGVQNPPSRKNPNVDEKF